MQKNLHNPSLPFFSFPFSVSPADYASSGWEIPGRRYSLGGFIDSVQSMVSKGS